MTATIDRDGAFALKTSHSYNYSVIASLVKLTGKLRLAGIPVLETLHDQKSKGIRLPWIAGPTMREQFEAGGPASRTSDLFSISREIDIAMNILGKLHASRVRHDMQVFDPFRTIDRRLGEIDCEEAVKLREQLSLKLPRVPGGSIVHGDFHAGQLIYDARVKNWWLLDLDDVSYGYPESDVANFCVHLVTSPKIVDFDLLAAYRGLLALARRSYGHALAPDLLNHFAAAAFLRRALKSAEKNQAQDWVAEQLATGAALAS